MLPDPVKANEFASLWLELYLLSVEKIQLFDLCFLSTEIYLFFALVVILFQYSRNIKKIIKLQHYILQNFIVQNNTDPFVLLTKKLNAGLILIIQRLIKALKICLFLLVCNPILHSNSQYLLGGFLVSTPPIVFLKIIIIICAILILQSNLFYFFFENNRNSDFVLLFGFMVFCLLLMLQAADLFLLFLLFEIVAILFYITLAIQKSTVNPAFNLAGDYNHYQKFLIFAGNSREDLNNGLFSLMSGLVYFLLNTLMTGFFLFSLTIFLMMFHTTNFLTMSILLNEYSLNFDSPLILVGFLALLCFFFFKLSIVPFHGWIPAVFEGAPYVTIMFLAVPVKICVITVFVKILYLIFNTLVFLWQPVLVVSALLSMIVGSLGLVFQVKLKKFWAYSTINHMGYMLLAIATHSWAGLRAVGVYLVGYIVMNLGFFLICLILTNDTLNQRIVFLNHLVTFRGYTHSLTSGLFAFIMFSLIGIPPLFGFWGKYCVLISVIITFKTMYIIGIIIIIIVTSLIATVAYLKLWKFLYIRVDYNLKEREENDDYTFAPINLHNMLALLFYVFIIGWGPIWIFGGKYPLELFMQAFIWDYF